MRRFNVGFVVRGSNHFGYIFSRKGGRGKGFKSTSGDLAAVEIKTKRNGCKSVSYVLVIGDFVWINVYLLGQRDGREVIQGVLEMQWIRWIRMNCPFNLEREGESYETNVLEET